MGPWKRVVPLFLGTRISRSRFYFPQNLGYASLFEIRVAHPFHWFYVGFYIAFKVRMQNDASRNISSVIFRLSQSFTLIVLYTFPQYVDLPVHRQVRLKNGFFYFFFINRQGDFPFKCFNLKILVISLDKLKKHLNLPAGTSFMQENQQQISRHFKAKAYLWVKEPGDSRFRRSYRLS